MKLIMVSQPRSCSSWLIQQIAKSPDFKLWPLLGGEFTSVGMRHNIRRWLKLPELDNAECWYQDIRYLNMFFDMHPNGCVKLLGNVHGAELFEHVYQSPEYHVCTTRRTDTPSALASLIANSMRRARKDDTAFHVPARDVKVEYGNMPQWMNLVTVDDNRLRHLDTFYYCHIVKAERWVRYFEDHPRNLANVVDMEGARDLERATGCSFDWDTLLPQSHYRDIFSDWELYERDIEHVLGLKPTPYEHK